MGNETEGNLHARRQQLHAHHQRAAYQLPVALQRPLRPVLVLRGQFTHQHNATECAQAVLQRQSCKALHHSKSSVRCSPVYPVSCPLPLGHRGMPPSACNAIRAGLTLHSTQWQDLWALFLS